MSRYDANQLRTMLQGATPLQALVGTEGAMEAGMTELGVQAAAPQPQQPQMTAPAADTAWNAVLKGPEL